MSRSFSSLLGADPALDELKRLLIQRTEGQSVLPREGSGADCWSDTKRSSASQARIASPSCRDAADSG